MPPSGYTSKQTDYAVDFLLSCGNSLLGEIRTDSLTPIAGLEREIANIDCLLRSDCFSKLERTVFMLNRDYYTQLLERRPLSVEQFEEFLVIVADEIRASLRTVEDRTPSVLAAAICASI